MTHGWQTLRLDDLCSIELGRTPARDDARLWDAKRSTGNVWLSIADLLEQEGGVVADSKEYVSDQGAAICKLVPAGTLLLSFKLTLGRLAVAGRNLYTNEAIAALGIREPDRLDRSYLRYFLEAFDWDKATEGDHKIKGRTLNKAKLKEIGVLVPPLPEQRGIVAILDEAFEAIATAKANTEKNLQNAQAILDGHLHELFSQHREGWQVARVVECFKVRSGDFLPAKSMVTDGAVPVYGGNGVAGTHNAANLSGEQVVIGRVGAKCGNVRHVVGDIWLTDNAFHISEYLRPFDPAFLAKLLGLKNLRQTANQAAQPVISYTTIKNVELSFPVSIESQRDIASKLGKLEGGVADFVEICERKLAALDELKKSLLHQAFTGQITAKSTDQQLAEVA